MQLDKYTAPWAFDRGEAFRAIASLEALAALLAIFAFSEAQSAVQEGTLLLCGHTDNRGNKFVLTR